MNFLLKSFDDGNGCAIECRETRLGISKHRGRVLHTRGCHYSAIHIRLALLSSHVPFDGVVV